MIVDNWRDCVAEVVALAPELGPYRIILFVFVTCHTHCSGCVFVFYTVIVDRATVMAIIIKSHIFVKLCDKFDIFDTVWV